jgi:CheY-like chemotaxis protein
VTILVVEDDQMLRASLVTLFKRRGYAVQAAASGNEAIRILSSNATIDLILSDYYMPDGDGGQLLRYVRSIDPKRPRFIMITGQADTSVELPGEGIDEVLYKPVDIATLMTIVARYTTP